MAAIPPNPATIAAARQTFNNTLATLQAQVATMTTATSSQNIAAVLDQLQTATQTLNTTIQPTPSHQPLVFPLLVSFKTAAEQRRYWGTGGILNQLNKYTTTLKAIPVNGSDRLRMGVVFLCLDAANINITNGAQWHATVFLWHVNQQEILIYDPGFPADYATL